MVLKVWQYPGLAVGRPLYDVTVVQIWIHVIFFLGICISLCAGRCVKWRTEVLCNWVDLFMSRTIFYQIKPLSQKKGYALV